jgi:hypothetical protein
MKVCRSFLHGVEHNWVHQRHSVHRQ